MSSRLLALVFFLVSALGSSPSAAPHQELHRSPLAIDGVEVSWTEFACWLVHFRGRENIRAFALRRALDRTASTERIHLRDEDLRRRIEEEIEQRVAGAFEGDRARWEAELALQQLTPESYVSTRLEELKVQEWTEALARKRRALAEPTLRAQWEQEYGLGGRSLEVARLFLKVTLPPQREGATRDEVLELGRKARAAVEQRAQELAARVAAGEDFTQLVAEFSEDEASKAKGGRLPGRFLAEAWTGVDESALAELPLGGVTAPIYSRGGYNLFQVVERKLHPFEEVRAELEQQLLAAPATAAESEALNAELLDGLAIELLPELEREVGLDDPRIERPVFTIDGVPITREVYATWLVPARGRPLAKAFVDRRVVRQEAQAASISLSRVEIDTRIAEDTERLISIFHQGDRDAWLAEQESKGSSEAEFYRASELRVSHTLLAEKLLLARRVITPELIERAWSERYGEDGRSLDVRFILMTIPDPAEGELEDSEDVQRYIREQSQRILKDLERLRQRALNGEDFSALARTYSEDPLTRDSGGRGAGRFELHTWPEEVQVLLRALSPGQVAPPYEMNGQFFLFELAGIVVVPLEEVRELLAQELLVEQPSQVQVAGFVNRLTQGLDVSLLPGMFFAD